MKVRADSRPNNKNGTVLQFKTGDFVKFRQNSSKINIFVENQYFRHNSGFSSFCQRQKRNRLEPSYYVTSKLGRAV